MSKSIGDHSVTSYRVAATWYSRYDCFCRIYGARLVFLKPKFEKKISINAKYLAQIVLKILSGTTFFSNFTVSRPIKRPKILENRKKRRLAKSILRLIECVQLFVIDFNGSIMI